MKPTGKRYFEVAAPHGTVEHSSVVRIRMVGKGRNARVVTSAGGSITCIPLIRAQRGPLKRLKTAEEIGREIDWNPSPPSGYKAW